MLAKTVYSKSLSIKILRLNKAKTYLRYFKSYLKTK